MNQELPTHSATNEDAGASNRDTRRDLFLLKIAILTLCMSVFAWGLHYKLSLYDHAQPLHPTNVAKLIQGEQRHRTPVLTASPNHSPTLTHVIVSSVLCFQPLAEFRHSRNVGDSVAPFLAIRHVHLFSRPPPQSL